MAEERPGRGKEFLLGAIVGSVLGAVTALLLAPKTGKELREDLSGQVHSVSEKTQRIAGTLGNKTQDIAKQLSAHTEEWVQKAKEVVDSVAEEVKAWKGSRKEIAATCEEEIMPANAEVLVREKLK